MLRTSGTQTIYMLFFPYLLPFYPHQDKKRAGNVIFPAHFLSFWCLSYSMPEALNPISFFIVFVNFIIDDRIYMFEQASWSTIGNTWNEVSA